MAGIRKKPRLAPSTPCTHAAHASAPDGIVAALKLAYEARFGWVHREINRLCVALPYGEDVKLPGGLWQTRACCSAKESGCLRALTEQDGRVALAPRDVGWDFVEAHHSRAYCDKLRADPTEVADIFEIEAALLSGNDLEHDVFLPMRRIVGGTVIAAALAVAYGGCVLFDGGAHHASRDMGAGASLFDDAVLSFVELTAALKEPLGRSPRALYVDLDVHLSDGVCHDVHDLGLTAVFNILDAYNADIWPVAGPEGDREAPSYVDVPIVLSNGMRDAAYLRRLGKALADAEERFERPDVLYYVAGMDVLDGDAVGGIKLSAAGIAARDDMVLSWACRQRIPVVFLVGGGYSDKACAVARSSVKSALALYATDVGSLDANTGACPRCREVLHTRA